MTHIEMMNYDMMEHEPEEITEERAHKLEIEKYEKSEECLNDHIKYDLYSAILNYMRHFDLTMGQMQSVCDSILIDASVR